MSTMLHPLSIDDVEEVILRESPTHKPTVRIVEQPSSRGLRFRYKCEGRSAGSLLGENSTPELKTYPTIKIENNQGRSAVLVGSCVTKDIPYRPHPHNLVGKGCKKGVLTVILKPTEMTYSFVGLGIQCVKKNDIEESLKVRARMNVDPFQTGFAHAVKPSTIDLNVVRLAFQVFIEGSAPGKFQVPLPVVVTEPIFDKKTMSDLSIVKLSHCSASVAGGTEMILLCEKVNKDDVEIWFVDNPNGPTWKERAEFHSRDIYKQVAITFRTPKYHDQNISRTVTVYIQLYRPTTNSFSEPRPFQFFPKDRDPDILKRKKARLAQGMESLAPRPADDFDYYLNQITQSMPAPQAAYASTRGSSFPQYSATSPYNPENPLFNPSGAAVYDPASLANAGAFAVAPSTSPLFDTSPAEIMNPAFEELYRPDVDATTVKLEGLDIDTMELASMSTFLQAVTHDAENNSIYPSSEPI